ncbi:MAG: diguanylate cyclase [Acidobacteriota bacterium]
MLTYAIGFIQNVQFACFAIVFLAMVLLERDNRSFRWFAYAYLSGVAGGAFQYADRLLPIWLSLPVLYMAAPAGYACINAGVVEFLGRGRRTRVISLLLIFGSLPFYIGWALAVRHSFLPYMDWIATLEDITLAIQTAITTAVLCVARDTETVWPRRVMGAFLGFYSAVEFARVVVFFVTGHIPGQVAPWVEVASGIVYVVSCSVLPLNFIWMQNARLYAHMGRQMTTDVLTDVLNRRGLEAAGEAEVTRYLRDRREFTIAILDIDHFKRLNDTHGHATGDAVLQRTTGMVRQMVRKTDVVGRLGGEEFVLLLPSTPIFAAVRLIEHVRASIEAEVIATDGAEVSITASFGLATTSGRRDLTWPQLLNEADQALYAAKRDGRNVARLYRPGIGITASEALTPVLGR